LHIYFELQPKPTLKSFSYTHYSTGTHVHVQVCILQQLRKSVADLGIFEKGFLVCNFYTSKANQAVMLLNKDKKAVKQTPLPMKGCSNIASYTYSSYNEVIVKTVASS